MAADRALIILDPFSSGKDYKAEAKSLGLVPLVVKTYEPPHDAPIHAFLPRAEDYDHSVFVDHYGVLFGPPGALAEQVSVLATGLGQELAGRGLTPAGVVAGSELSVPFTDALATHWSLPGNDARYTIACRHKGRMKEHARRHDVGCADHVEVSTERAHEVDAFVARHYVPNETRPMFLKPPCGGGSTRVRKCQSRQDLLACLPGVAGQPDFFGFRSPVALLESYVSGTEYAVNLWGDGTDALVTDIWRYDRRDTEAGLGFGTNVYHSAVTIGPGDAAFQILSDEALRIARAFGRARGPMHIEMKLDGERVSLIEIGSRLAGGGMPRLLQDISGWSVLAATVANACGLPHAPFPGVTNMKCAALAFGYVVKGGVVKSVRGADAMNVRHIPTLRRVFDHLPQVGYFVQPTEDTSTSPLTVHLVGDDPDEIARDVRRVHDCFGVDVW